MLCDTFITSNDFSFLSEILGSEPIESLNPCEYPNWQGGGLLFLRTNE